MNKKIEKNSTLFNFFRDYYTFIQDYAVPEDNDLFWERLMHEADKLTKKYKEIEEYMTLSKKFGVVRTVLTIALRKLEEYY